MARRSAPPSSSARGHLLLAEDNSMTQRVTRFQLEDLGFTVDLAANGREALEALDRGRYDLVLMDCQMPELDGYQATREIRRREASGARHVPVIALTAHAIQGDREKCLASGMDDYLAKPVQTEDLGALLDRWLGSATAGPATPPAGVAAAEGEDAPVLDTETLEVLRQLTRRTGRDLVAQVLGLFLDQGPQRRDLLEETFAAGNRRGTQEHAHWFKGSCDSVGAGRLRELSRQLEDWGRGGGADDVGELWSAFCGEYDRVESEVRRLLLEAPARGSTDGGEGTGAGATRGC